MIKDTKEMLHFHILPSKRFTLLFNALHCMAVLACWFNDLQINERLILMLAVLLAWCLAKKRWKVSDVHLRYTSSNGWWVSSGENSYSSAVILDTSVITGVIIVLHYKMENQTRRALLIAKDSLSSNQFRRLVVRLALSMHGQER